MSGFTRRALAVARRALRGGGAQRPHTKLAATRGQALAEWRRADGPWAHPQPLRIL